MPLRYTHTHTTDVMRNQSSGKVIAFVAASGMKECLFFFFFFFITPKPRVE